MNVTDYDFSSRVYINCTTRFLKVFECSAFGYLYQEYQELRISFSGKKNIKLKAEHNVSRKRINLEVFIKLVRIGTSSDLNIALGI